MSKRNTILEKIAEAKVAVSAAEDSLLELCKGMTIGVRADKRTISIEAEDALKKVHAARAALAELEAEALRSLDR